MTRTINDLSSPQTLEEAVGQRDHWYDCAAQFHRNEAYYQGLLDQIGEAIGDDALVADDGSRPGGILRAKLPGLVGAALAPAENTTAGKLCSEIECLLDLDARNALVPHGVGGVARQVLLDVKVYINTQHRLNNVLIEQNARATYPATPEWRDAMEAAAKVCDTHAAEYEESRQREIKLQANGARDADPSYYLWAVQTSQSNAAAIRALLPPSTSASPWRDIASDQSKEETDASRS